MGDGEVIKFYDIEVPIAISMVELAERATHPFQQYFCYWAAFNNIYTLIGRRRNLHVQLSIDSSTNTQRTQMRWGYTFPRVTIPQERQLIEKAIAELAPAAKRLLLQHTNIHFFADRIPLGIPHNRDTSGQLINGVLNMTRTANSASPVWSPIDRQKYEDYTAGNRANQDELVEQIVFMLYTIRNNLVHGSKNQNEANDTEVVELALPLLKIIVCSFLHKTE